MSSIEQKPEADVGRATNPVNLKMLQETKQHKHNITQHKLLRTKDEKKILNTSRGENTHYI